MADADQFSDRHLGNLCRRSNVAVADEAPTISKLIIT